MTIKPIAAALNGANQVVAGVAGRAIRVFAFVLSFSGAVNAKWQSAAADQTGLFYGAANTVVPSPVMPAPATMQQPIFTTNAGEDLNLNLSGAVAVGGYVVYDQLNI